MRKDGSDIGTVRRPALQRLVGLNVIANACMTTPEVLFSLREKMGFPMMYVNGQWRTSRQAIEVWAKRRVAAEQAIKRAHRGEGVELPKPYPRQECRVAKG
jgi:hypothetical protein